MRPIIIVLAIITAISAAYKFGQRHPGSETHSPAPRAVLYYVDPMHPAYRSDKPGIAPDCGMQLQPVFADSAISLVSLPTSKLTSGTVHIDVATQQLLGIKLATVETYGATRMLRAVGRVAPEDTRVYSVNSGVDGFIRSTQNDAVGTLVSKDQKLASYYSPEFLTAASGFLAASERVPGSLGKQSGRNIDTYTDRLRNLGMSDVQIKEVVDTRQLPGSIDVVAPESGFIFARSISPGQHFMRETEFYKIVDLSRMWIVAEIFEQEAAYLRAGLTAQVTLKGTGHRLTAMITDSRLQSEVGGGTVKVRFEVANPRFLLRPEMLVDLELPVRIPAAVTVPADALIDSGAHARLYVARSGDTFEPHEVETGWRSGDRVEILKGVQPGDRVVTSATFLVDSESRMNTLAAPPPAVHTPRRPSAVPQHVAVANSLPNSGHESGTN